MTIRLMGTVFGAAVMAAGFTLAASAPALAASAMKECGAKYEAAKTANALNGMTWSQFYSKCSADMKATPAAATAPAAPAAATTPAKPMPAPAAAAPAVVAPAPAAAAKPMPAPTMAAPAKPMAPAVAPTALNAPGKAGHDARMKACGAEWDANKVTLKAQYASWPKYYSACNTRMKTTGM